MSRSSNLPKSIAKLAQSCPAKVASVSVEFDEFDGPSSPYSYWLYLKPGWINHAAETHFVHEVSVADFMESWRSVRPCECDDCRATIAKTEGR